MQSSVVLEKDPEDPSQVSTQGGQEDVQNVKEVEESLEEMEIIDVHESEPHPSDALPNLSEVLEYVINSLISENKTVDILDLWEAFHEFRADLVEEITSDDFNALAIEITEKLSKKYNRPLHASNPRTVPFIEGPGSFLHLGEDYS